MHFFGSEWLWDPAGQELSTYNWLLNCKYIANNQVLSNWVLAFNSIIPLLFIKILPVINESLWVWRTDEESPCCVWNVSHNVGNFIIHARVLNRGSSKGDYVWWLPPEWSVPGFCELAEVGTDTRQMDELAPNFDLQMCKLFCSSSSAGDAANSKG